ncbi:hypothetical protein BpHYR1_006336 [Brachionus plicatilis]|uniref:Uncharacterized protein n=1 Tax=Brachionus plicatilis TaxID=10195 RepID=A0A3M7RID6_BRAPC|nr:hypothetical protein BpHYR1_006336 [Brachionus plicatilis]
MNTPFSLLTILSLSSYKKNGNLEKYMEIKLKAKKILSFLVLNLINVVILAVRSILKLKYDTPSNILHQEAYNKLKLLTISNRLCELSERYIRAGLRALARYRYTNK